MTLTIELEKEADGRWIAEVPTLPGTMCYGKTRVEAMAHVQALALRVIAEPLEHKPGVTLSATSGSNSTTSAEHPACVVDD